MRRKISCDFRKYLADQASAGKAFRKDETGSLSTMSAVLIPLMLITGGMSVDFMRFESERILLQDTADRAALAAANLEFTDPGAGVALVRDFFRTAGLEEYLDGDPIVTETINSRTVEVNVKRELDTFFIKLAGIDTLSANATSVATQGVGNVEISLVLDISGSMGNPTYDEAGNATGESKMDALKAAASTFIETALQDTNRDRVSISLIPYSQHVNAGEALFNSMSVNQLHNFSHCIDFSDSDFSTPGISSTQTYQQAQHFDRFSGNTSMSYTSCPNDPGEAITPMSQDKDALLLQISQLKPTTQTSIFLGMKWGLALLDPSANDLIDGEVDAVFADRPAPFSGDEGSSSDTAGTVKVIVVMTDGQNTTAHNIRSEFYTDPNDIQHWGTTPIPYWINNNAVSMSINSLMSVQYNANKGDDLLADTCAAANDNNVQVFAIAFEAPQRGIDAMAGCATTTNHFFNTNGDDLEAVFRAIAEQVTSLRLTQ